MKRSIWKKSYSAALFAKEIRPAGRPESEWKDPLWREAIHLFLLQEEIRIEGRTENAGEDPLWRKAIQLFSLQEEIRPKGQTERAWEIQSGEKPFTCSHCEKKFVLKEDLREHERIQSGEKPFIWSCCWGNSSWRTTWESMRGSLWRKAFTCSDCKRKFVPKNDLREHENRRKASFHQHWSDGFSEYLEAQLLPSESGHSVSLFTRGKLSKFPMTSNHRQNCSIGQLISKKLFFSPGQFGPRRKRKGKSGEIRSLLETLGSTL